MSYRRKSKYHYKEEKRNHIVFSADPLSLAHPTSTDFQNKTLLENVLREAGRLKESKQGARRREYVLQDLDQICQEWVKTSARTHNHPEEFVSNSKVRLFAFGSYKLDVHSLGDDVDLLCVGPRFLTRDMFFEELGPLLTSNSCVEHFYSVPAAYVPVMSFKYNGIDIDLVYAQLQIELLDSEWNINDDYNLRNLDQASIYSINGVRLAHKTLDLVPNKDVFRLSLRAVRYWAKQRGIYSNKLGYLGGVSWAILTARVCQLYPYSNSSQIVQNFFLFYHIWNFGTPLKAITLCNIVQHEDMPSIKVWDPNDHGSKYELMHVITPAFPAMNSTHNVSISTFEVLKKEIARAFHLLSRAKKTVNEDKWGELFRVSPFFIDHKNYIFIKACAPNRYSTEWSGLIESKIRSFVNSLEHDRSVNVIPFCRSIKLKLTKEEIKECTHADVLKELEIKRKQRLEIQKEKLLVLKRKKLEGIRLEQLRANFHNRIRAEKALKAEKSDDAETESTDDVDGGVDNGEKENEKEKDKSVVISINDGENEEKEENEVMIISNLSLPIETMEKSPSKSKSVSLNSNESPTKSKKESESVSPATKPTKSASNPYIYVAPELQRKYTYRGRNRRGRYGRYHRSYNNNAKAVVSTATTSPNTETTGDDAKNDDESNKSVMHSNPHAFVVGKNQIACCHSFSNKILREKAEKGDKYGNYECRAFVIGLRVVAIGEDSAPRWDFSHAVLSFLKGVGHIYTDAHLIIERINCNKIPHFLFPQHGYKRPNKKEIELHQKQVQDMHLVWRSKSCTATLNQQQQKALSSPSASAESVPVSGVSGSAADPQFDKDDILMNDDSMEAMPGLDLDLKIPTQIQTNEEKKNENENDNENEDDDVNVDVNMSINEDNDDIDNGDGNENGVEPSVKRRKLMNGDYCNGDMAKPKVEEEEEEESSVELRYLNPYFEGINWDEKYDNSPTFSYALKLYKSSLAFTSWSTVCHDLTATATHIYNTCNDQSWKIKLKKVLSDHKYGWNGCKYAVILNKKLMFDLAHDIAYNYIEHKNEKKRKRKF